MVRLGVLGYGAWGKNLARVAFSTPGARLVAVAETDAARREEARARLLGVELLLDERALFARSDVDAVLVATPAPSHPALVEAAAAAGKHVFVEKPLALEPSAARRAAAAAERAGVALQVGHLLRYHPAVELLFQVARNELGRLRCVACQRLNFGALRPDENVLFSLGPHDVSVMLALFGERPESVAAHGAAFVRSGVEDLAFLTLRFPGGGLGQIHLSWLDPHKVRRITVVGERKMAVFDDMEPREKVRVYDQAVTRNPDYAVYGENLSLRFGDIRVPSFPPTEPLAVELERFVRCVRTGEPPLTGGAEGVLVVEVLAAAQRSLRNGGMPVALGSS